MVLLGEMRQDCRTLLTFTRPYLGTASSMSKTLAVSTYSGGSSRRSWMVTRPPLRSRLSVARFVRISFARWRGSVRGTRDRSGAAMDGLVGVFVAGGMGGESTSRARTGNPKRANSASPLVEVEAYSACLTVFARFAGILFDAGCARC